MLKLELDWASDEQPDETPYEGEPVRVELNEQAGPSGWPTVKVYVWQAAEGEQEYVQAMRLVGWLQDVYGSDEDEADELASKAESV